ncbi:MAG: Acetyl coenzyme A synthetase (ADP forming), alpha domain protein [Microgenomates bacterium 39_6]|nr:MAG: Acetyl coenzyme A synthetase (ADP forming), alpha domain protein [Microgenomates bacterium 39_6]
MVLKKLFCPESIAVIGASRNSQKIGHLIFSNLINSNFQGKLYPINPKAKNILGYKALPSILDLSEPVDLAIIVVPAEIVPLVLEQVGQSGTKTTIIISAGFAEIGPEGQKKQDQLIKIAQKYDLKFLGPNCLGIINPKIGLNASWGEVMPNSGKIGFASQSGALAAPVIELINESDLGFSYFASLGNKANLDEADLIEFFGQDKNTDLIIAYLESFKNGQRLINLAQKITSQKPLVILKAGNTSQGAKSAQSHTASLATPQKITQGVFAQANIIEANSLTDLINLAKLLTVFAQKSLGPKTAIVTNAGGPGVLTTDALIKNNLSLANFSKKTTKKLASFLPQEASLNNPIDILGNANEKIYFKTCQTVISDPAVDNLIVILTKQRGTNVEAIAQKLTQLKNKKPLIPIFMGGESVRAAKDIFQKNQMTSFGNPQETLLSLAKIIFWQKKNKQKVIKNKTKINRKKIEKLIGQANRSKLNEAEGLQLLSTCQIDTPKFTVFNNQKEGIKTLKKIGCPAFLKVLSAEIAHRTEAEAVKKITSKKTFIEQFNKMKKKFPQADFILSEAITGELEIIIGVKKDPAFGHLLMVGAGGIYTEILKDRTFRALPITKNDAQEMLSELRIYPILKGARGKKKVNLDKIEKTLLVIAKLVDSFPQISQLDINPLIVNYEEAAAVDVKISLDNSSS